MEKSHVVLSDADHAQFTTMLHQSDLSSKVFRRVTTLLELHKGKTIEEVRGVLGLTYPGVAALIDHYEQSGLECLHDQPKPGRLPRIDGKQRALITALACSPTPEGHAKWSLRLLADKAVELQYCETISHEHVSRILKKTKSGRI